MDRQDRQNDGVSLGDRWPGETLALNPQDYTDELANLDLSEDQAREMLEVLWQIMSQMVQLGWGVDSVSLLLPELFGKSETNASSEARSDVEYTHTNNQLERGPAIRSAGEEDSEDG